MMHIWQWVLVLPEYVAEHKDQFKGTLKLIFQPAEEGVRGAKAMVNAGVVDDVDYMFGLHIGFNENYANCFACSNHGFLATTKLDAVFHGYAAHAGSSQRKRKMQCLQVVQQCLIYKPLLATVKVLLV